MDEARLHPTVEFEVDRHWLWLLIAAGSLLGCEIDSQSPDDAVQEVKIAAAADLKFALQEIVAAFHQSQTQVKVSATHGSSGQLCTQLMQGAPFDVFLSADRQFPRQLVERDLALADTEFLYAHGHLVLWVTNDSPLDLDQGLNVLLDPRVKKIAIANPRFAPYGRAAEAALKNSGVYGIVAERLVLGENIAQTAQFVESGSADIGILALSLALAPAMSDKGRYWSVPEDLYPTLEQGGVIMKRCEHPQAAQKFCEFFRGDEGRTILRRYGFVLPQK